MNSKSYIYSSTKRHKVLRVTANQMLLLKMIGSLGFVTSKQLDMLWSVVQQYPTTFSHTILSKWSGYDGLLNFVPISASLNINRSRRSTTAASHNCYILSTSCSKWLDKLNILPSSWDNTSINSHNEQAVETIVQALYTARFGSSMLEPTLPFYSFTDGQYSYCSQAINGCIKKGVIKGAKKKCEVKSAKHTVKLTLVPKEKVNQLNSNATAVLNRVRECLSPNTYSDISSILPYLTHIVDTLHTDGISITPLTKYFIHSASIDNHTLYAKAKEGLSPNISTANNSNDKIALLSDSISLHTNNNFTLSSAPDTPNCIHFIYYTSLVDSLLLLRTYSSNIYPSPLRDVSLIAPGVDKLSIGSQISYLTMQNREMLSTYLGDWRNHFSTLWGDEIYKKAVKPIVDKHKQPMDYNPLSLSPLRGMLLGYFKDVNGILLGYFWNQLGKYYKEVAISDYFALSSRLSWCSFSIEFIQHLELCLSFFLKMNTSGRYLSGASLNTDKTPKIKTSRSIKHSYVAESAKPRKYKNKIVRIDSQKFNKLSNNKNYSNNLLNQQDQLLGLLDDNYQPNKISKHKNKGNINKKANPQRKKGSASNIPLQVKRLFNYYFPNQDYLVQVFSKVSLPTKIKNFAELTVEQQVLLVNLAEDNLHIYKYFIDHHQIADYISSNHLDLPFKTKFTSSQATLDRDVDLISNPYLDLSNYDFRSFNQQFGFKNFAESKDLPFVADMMISFYRKRRKHEIFLELDNRTEANNTQIQKIMNYIWYALENPDKDVDMVIAITDGSLKSKRVPEYTNIGRKLGNLATQFIKTYLNTSSNKKAYLATLYRQATNLHIYLSGVSEAHLDIAKILLGSNDLVDKLLTIKQLVSQLSYNSRWNVTYIPSDAVKTLESNPDLLFSTGNDSVRTIINSNVKGIFRYVAPDIKNDFSLGMFKFTDKLTGHKQYQQIINAEEHDLDTIIAMYNSIYSPKNNLKQLSQVPISVFQHCLEVNTAISLPSYAKKFKYTSTYSPTLPYFIQPRYNNNLPSHKVIRWLLVQYSKEVANYFLFGAINKAALSKNPEYGTEYVNLLVNLGQARSYEELHALAQELSPESFTDQLRLDEVPIGLFKTLVARWPSQAYCIPRFMRLPFVKTPKDMDFFKIKDNYEFKEFIHGLDSTIPAKRFTNIL